MGSNTWGVPGGKVARGENGDRSFLDTASREWNEEVPCGVWQFAVNDSFKFLQFAVSKKNASTWVSASNFPEHGRSEIGKSCVVWIFAAATSEFFLKSEWNAIDNQLLDLAPPPGIRVVRPGDPKDLSQCVHTHGALLLE